MLENLRAFPRYRRDLRDFLSRPLSYSEAQAMLSRGLDSREEGFLELLQQGVFGRPRNPYRVLFAEAGIELGDVARMVREDGLEHTLARLHDAGVRLSLAEVKGKEPVHRGQVELWIGSHDLDNPLLARHWEGRSGGSRSRGTRFWVDLREVEEAAAYFAIARSAFGLERADAAIWRSGPPAIAGIKASLWVTKGGTPVRRWFAETVPRWRPGTLRHAAFVHWTVAASHRAGQPLAAPEHTPPARADRVARWLAKQVEEGRPALLVPTPSSAVRICSADRRSAALNPRRRSARQGVIATSPASAEALCMGIFPTFGSDSED